jgi:ribosomal-protein-alanine N-acetyltransferase
MTIRAATLSDLETLAAIHSACFAEAWRADSFGHFLASPGTFALLSADGFILARVSADEAEILSLGVPPSARRRGQARALVVDAATQAHDKGAAAMFLEVGINNIAARRLYAALGFRDGGIRKGYYREPGKPPEDALSLRAELPLARLGKATKLD